MVQFWTCPGCGRSHRKEFSYGPVVGQYGALQARHMFHRDVVCGCGRRTAGLEILGGLHDDHKLQTTAAVAENAVGCGGLLGLVVGAILGITGSNALAFWVSLVIGLAVGGLLAARAQRRLARV